MKKINIIAFILLTCIWAFTVFSLIRVLLHFPNAYNIYFIFFGNFAFIIVLYGLYKNIKPHTGDTNMIPSKKLKFNWTNTIPKSKR